MAKRYIEVTIALDDAAPDTLEVFHRSKEGEEPWSDPSETEDFAPTSILATSWVELEIKKV